MSEKNRLKGMKPVKVWSCADRVQADMIIEALRSEGIPAYSQSEGSGDYMNIYMGNSIFGEKIYVDEGDQERAAQIIKGMTPSDQDGTQVIEEDELSDRSQSRKMLAVKVICFIAALFLLLGAVVPSIMNIIMG